ncbi:MAG: hypothetical protein IIC75_00380 [Bacteroidetes bacterium]|nr:hypothetical protein [Bacteroidota bacterium]
MENHFEILLLKDASELLHNLLNENSFSEIEGISYHETLALRNEIDVMLIKNTLSERKKEDQIHFINRILFPSKS